MRVRATQRGFHDNILRERGMEFDLSDISELSDAKRVGKATPGWMEVVSCSAEEQKQLDALRAANQAEVKARRGGAAPAAPAAAAPAKK